MLQVPNMDWLFADASLPVTTTTTPAPTLPVTLGSTQSESLTATTKSDDLSFSEFDPNYEFVSNIDFSDFFSESTTITSEPNIDYDVGVVDVVDVDTSDLGSGLGVEGVVDLEASTSTLGPIFSTTTELPEINPDYVRAILFFKFLLHGH